MIQEDAQQNAWTLNELEGEYARSFFLENFIQDFEMILGNAGTVDPHYYQLRIDFCRHILANYESQFAGNTLNFKRAIAESYASLDDFASSDAEHKQMVEDHPADPWVYISWGDSYNFFKRKDKASAREMYEKAMEIAKDNHDRAAIRKRLADL